MAGSGEKASNWPWNNVSSNGPWTSDVPSSSYQILLDEYRTVCSPPDFPQSPEKAPKQDLFAEADDPKVIRRPNSPSGHKPSLTDLVTSLTNEKSVENLTQGLNHSKLKPTGPIGISLLQGTLELSKTLASDTELNNKSNTGPQQQEALPPLSPPRSSSPSSFDSNCPSGSLEIIPRRQESPRVAAEQRSKGNYKTEKYHKQQVGRVI